MSLKKIIGSDGNVFRSITELAKVVHKRRNTISGFLKQGSFEHDGVKYHYEEEGDKEDNKVDEEYENYKSAKKNDFEFYKFGEDSIKSGDKFVIALFSDAHIEETVNKDSVLGLNEYNTEIAKYRIERYFVGLSKCLQIDGASKLFFASLGDTISGFIHESLQQENGMTPPEAVIFGQSLIVSGLKYLKEHNPNIDITFIGIYGNHSRLTKKIQYDNGFKLSYEYIMYKNIKSICELSGMDINFILPKSEMCLVELPNKERVIFIHGYQVRSSGTGSVCGIYPALQRLAMKWDRTFHQNHIYLGHFHSSISIPTATVNGSIIGYNAFAMSNGFSCEEPTQMYELYDNEIGHILTRKIYCK